MQELIELNEQELVVEVLQNEGKRPHASVNNFTVLFDLERDLPAVGSMVKIMLTGVMKSEGKKTLFARLVTDDDVLVYHRGFERGGSQGSVISAQPTGNPNGLTMLSPGRLQSSLRLATPGYAYYSQGYASASGRKICRIEGVSSTDQLVI